MPSSDLKIGDNPAGLLGFALSLIQLLMHGSWIALMSWLASSGRAENLDSSSFLAWLLVILLCVSTVMTFVALYVCLGRGLRRPPRTLPLIGLGLSFFVGVLAFAVVVLSSLRFAAG